MRQRTLVVISGGLSRPSSTRLLADRLSAAAAERAAGLGVAVSVRVVELRDLAHDLMNHLLTGFPPAPLREVLDAVEAADGLIAVTPIFNASYSGLFKSFFDVLGKDTLDGKPVLLAATGGTARHSLALEHAVRPMFAYLRAAPVPTSVFAASQDWGGDEAEGQLRVRVARAAEELAREIERREPAAVADPFALTTSFEELLAGG
ncbi:FMN reductase [Actinoplanes sp. NBRC 14428]|uniref:FMN reductase n=1 Tax=Pseudosporangium ferrugineum TaxID=439699 RepID=A0A2T0SJ08_9ACTN|nr:FMN reductase [Pseudosporangium ferrugineum]PRY33400.1 FMN reductase [Pseudosporangium ferrugineum]BCJ48600.1 FMN reductase [Actinoplanes sp. NBRC 14428]